MTALYESAGRRDWPGWRSVHFIPANVPRFVDKATSLAPDAFQIDLEDSVPEHEKDSSRTQVRAIATRLLATGADVLVRVNRPLRHAVRDVEASVCKQVSALTFGKIDGPSHVRLMDELISDCELREGLPLGHTRMNVIIETPQAFQRMEAIASASPRIAAMMLGTEDFSSAVGSSPIDEVMLGPKQQMIIAARAAGVQALGYIGSIANFRDPEAFRQMVHRSRAFGFIGGTSIHPLQIAVLNEEFGVTDAQADHAQRMLQANDQAIAEGRGSFVFDGAMVDLPIIDRARQLLACHASQRRTLRPSN